MKKNFVVNADLDFMTYIRTVEKIVNEHFDDEGSYVPHIGKGFVMTLFYDTCVKCEHLANKLLNCKTEVDFVDVLANDSQFMSAFNEYLYPFPNDYKLNFANAYSDAMDMIEDKRSSASRMTSMIESILNGFTDRVAPALTKENLDAVKQITTNMTGGESTATALVRNLMELKK